jgi:hypothetical protein
LSVYIMDHGSHDRIYLDGTSGEWITPGELDGWLDQLEGSVPGGLKVNVIVDACFSGSMIDPNADISQEGRVVIASTGAYAVAYATSGGAAFSDVFIDALDQGMSLQGAFNEASWAVRLAHPDQTPWLDDNGDAVPNSALDGTQASARGFAFTGTFAEPLWPPFVKQAELRNVNLGNGQAEIWAQVDDDKNDILGVWATIYPPSYQPAPADERLAGEPVPVPLTNRGNGWYAVTYPGFDEPGAYRIVVYAQDRDGLQSRPKLVRTWAIYLPTVVKAQP